MYRAKGSVIIEDLFGLDQQFLKGHEYILHIDNIDKNILVRGANYIQYLPKQGYFLSREHVNEHFEWVNDEHTVASMGNSKLLSFKKMNDDEDRHL